jgi:hypothetical protein
MMRGLRWTAPGATSARVEWFAAGLLVLGFVGVVLWFDGVDFYHRNFFDAGPIVVIDNVQRIIFTVIFSWLIYVPGAAVVAVILSPAARVTLSPAERGVLGFGVGIAIWHVVMLILGILDLYDRPLIQILCLLIITASAPQFGRVAVAAWRETVSHFTALRRGRASPEAIVVTLIAAVAAWLLLRRGLFPGGGGDYYTHYFYYYLEVINNHGLAPNDVWYHYYYSKGSGLAFLGMLLTDPEAPALTTYPCVLCAGVAIATLVERMAPRSLWPAAGTLVYLLFYLLTFSAIGEIEFQKDHEEIAALVVLFAWALCMAPTGPALPFWVMAAATATAAAIVTQAVGMLLGLFVGLLVIYSIVRRRWIDMLGYGFVGAAIAGTVLAIFILSYRATGLATDQPLDLMLRFADPTRLDRWGVIPQLITVAWIRDNYETLVRPFGLNVLKELASFMRLGALWPFMLGPLFTLAVLKATDALAGGRLTLWPDAGTTAFAAATTARLAALLGFFAIIAVSMGRSQSVSFVRLSTFFVPLIALFGIAGSAWVLGRHGRRQDPWARTVLPVGLLVAVMALWQGSSHWLKRSSVEALHALQFLSGQLSLAGAYAYADSPYAFGGINPGALAAAKVLPYGTRIWSTNVDSYCMAPGCLIESVVSFKMSGRLDEIVGGDPELAKRRLQEEGLNYFIFMANYRLLDILPYSSLFRPETIGRYLGIKWTDGSTFLLTWIGPDTKPIDEEFLAAYKRALDMPESLWFVFSDLAPRLVTLAPVMRAEPWGRAGDAFIWRRPPPGSIDVVEASYGSSCRHVAYRSPRYNAYRDGNATAAVIRACNGKSRCRFTVDSGMLGDPAPGCDKDFAAEYRCGPGASPRRFAKVDGEADRVTVTLACAGVEIPNDKPR